MASRVRSLLRSDTWLDHLLWCEVRIGKVTPSINVGPPPERAFSTASFVALNDGKEVVSIHLNPIESISNRLLGNRLRSGLNRPWNGDGKLIVLTEKDRRGFEDTCKIHCLMKIALGGRPISKVYQSDNLITLDFSCPGRSNCMESMGPYRDRNGMTLIPSGARLPISFPIQ